MVESKERKEISVLKLINYNLIFFIPLIILYAISYYFSGLLAPSLEVSPNIVTEILMFFMSMITFFILIPVLRMRETIKGVRFALIIFIITSFVITIPSLVKGNYNILMSLLIYLGNFVFATFINCPDVIGISGDPEDWFKHKVQILIFMLYVSILLLYVFGFGWMYYQMANDPTYHNALVYQRAETPSYSTMIYYSFATSAMVGYGDVMPMSPGARFVFCIQTFMGVIINLLFISTLMMYVSYAQSNAQQNVEKRIREDEKELEKEVEEIEKQNREVDEEQEKKIRELQRVRSSELENRWNSR